MVLPTVEPVNGTTLISQCGESLRYKAMKVAISSSVYVRGIVN